MTQTRGTQIKGKERTEGKINILGAEKGRENVLKRNGESESGIKNILSDDIYCIRNRRKDIMQQHENTATKGIDIKKKKKYIKTHMARACKGAVKNSR